MIIVTLDIETITDWKPDEPYLVPRLCKSVVNPDVSVTTNPLWAPKDQIAPVAKHVPCVISWLVFDSKSMSLELKTYRRQDSQPELEAEHLDQLGGDLEKAQRIVTWNGRGFDMPLLGLRALYHRVNWSFWPGKSHRYGNYKKDLCHYDLMDLLGDQGGVRHIALDHVCELLGLPGKHDIHGSEVSRYWLEDPDRVVTYCQEDVWQTWLVYLRWLETFKCTGDSHQAIIHSWWKTSMDWVRDLPELKRWSDQVATCCDEQPDLPELQPQPQPQPQQHQGQDQLAIDVSEVPF